MGCKTQLASTFDSVDYMDDFVHSRLINITALTSIFSAYIPLAFWIWDYFENSAHAQVAQSFIFVAYFFQALAFSVLVLIPLLLGNRLRVNASISRPKIAFSILAYCVLLSYDALVLSKRAKARAVTSVDFVYIVTVVSTVSCVVGIVNYIYLFIKAPPNDGAFGVRRYQDFGGQISTKTEDDRTSLKIDDDEVSMISEVKDFLWPTLPNHDHDDDDDHDAAAVRGQVFYPSRLFAAVVLGLLLISGVFIQFYKLHLQLNSGVLDALQRNLNQLQSQDIRIFDGEEENESLENMLAIVLAVAIYTLEPLRFGILIGAIVGASAGIYASCTVFRAYKKKVLEFRVNRLSYGYRKESFPILRSAKLISILSVYLATTAFLWCVFVILCAAVFGNREFWTLVLQQWPLCLSYLIYYALDYGIVRFWFLSKMLSEKDGSLKPTKVYVFRFALILNDLMYLPLAAFLGLLRVTTLVLFCLLAFLRPDVNVYPKGLEDYDVSHLAFVSTVRLCVEREAEYQTGIHVVTNGGVHDHETVHSQTFDIHV
eukprot:CAMPEP_0202699386 /NCGR_PEP_ID=MMETSP1385-20130828/12610_1 /ASSEMBLY_ACC=CAM_ASM_000861 /TAXON_ID=933848 /ORGANISM="Elphidium margaritaceum" /LENGTH=540 /DNA_ID=CAMNT_0049356319 /DNA_START=1 /DNA_END=1623 /DNA_ORIENTATION=-